MLGFDTKLTKMLVQYAQIFNFPRVGTQYVHQTQTATAANMRSNSLAPFMPNSHSKVAAVLNNHCYKCKHYGPSLQEFVKAHHRLRVKAPFPRISIDLCGPYTLKATQNSRVMTKVWSLAIVCLSTGLVTHQLLDQITIPAVVWALWNHEACYSTAISHI